MIYGINLSGVLTGEKERKQTKKTKIAIQKSRKRCSSAMIPEFEIEDEIGIFGEDVIDLINLKQVSNER